MGGPAYPAGLVRVMSTSWDWYDCVSSLAMRRGVRYRFSTCVPDNGTSSGSLCPSTTAGTRWMLNATTTPDSVSGA